VQQSTAARLLRNSGLASKRVKCGAADRVVVDSDQVSIPRTWPGKIYRVREAAKRLGMSVSVLKTLKSSGIYEVNHILPTRAGFHELDLRAFTKKIRDLSSEQKGTCILGSGTVTLGSVLCGRRDSVEIKLNLVRALLSRNIPVLGDSDGTVGELIIDRDWYRQINADVQSASVDNKKNPITLLYTSIACVE
jgi:hypothetical protein